MVRYTPASKMRDVKYYAWAVYDSLYPVNTNDTFVCKEFVDESNLLQTLLIDDSDGSTVTTSTALNVVTVTDTVSNIHCTLFVYGVKEK